MMTSASKTLFALTLLVGLLLAVGFRVTAAQEGACLVIVNTANPTDQLPRDVVSSFLLKKTTRWDHGTAVQPVDQQSNSEIRQVFSRQVHRRSVASIKSYWQRQIFSGRDSPPQELGSDSDVVAYVRSNPGGIGYVSSSTAVQGVKVVTVVD